MHKISIMLRLLLTAIVFSLTTVIAAPVSQQAQPSKNGDEDEIRKIWDDGLLRKRQAGTGKNYRYRRVTPALPPVRRVQNVRRREPMPRDAVVGVTVWKIRPALPTDEVRELVHNPSKQRPDAERISLTAERMEAGTPLDEGEHVRISIESPRSGYLYVINRELYANETKGEPLLIFPTERTLKGNNRLQAGRMVMIPDHNDDPPYFTVRPNPRRKDQVAELLVVIISDVPLRVPILPEARTIPAGLVNGWESKWGAAYEQIEQEGGVGAGITREEFAASGDEQRELRQGDAAPQTVYRVRTRPGAPVLLKLKLPFKRSSKAATP